MASGNSGKNFDIFSLWTKVTRWQRPIVQRRILFRAAPLLPRLLSDVASFPLVSSLCGHARNFEENFVPLLVRPFTKSKPNRPFRSRTWNLYNFPLPASTYLNATTLSSHQSKRRCHIWKKYADSQPCGTWRTNFIQSATWHLATAGGSQFIRLLQLGPTGWASRQSNGRLTFADGQ